MTILVWLDRARGGSVHEVVGPSNFSLQAQVGQETRARGDRNIVLSSTCYTEKD
jgi:hypothetical protein